jgi:hypothetical protein
MKDLGIKLPTSGPEQVSTLYLRLMPVTYAARKKNISNYYTHINFEGDLKRLLIVAQSHPNDLLYTKLLLIFNCN